jgi:hypothetical protein
MSDLVQRAAAVVANVFEGVAPDNPWGARMKDDVDRAIATAVLRLAIEECAAVAAELAQVYRRAMVENDDTPEYLDWPDAMKKSYDALTYTADRIRALLPTVSAETKA